MRVLVWTVFGASRELSTFVGSGVDGFRNFVELSTFVGPGVDGFRSLEGVIHV